MGNAESASTPESLLTQLGETLLKKEGVDVELAEILKKHILTSNPAKDAPAKAKAAVLKLAMERAAGPKAGAAGG